MDPASQELQLRRAGVPLSNLFRDVGVSGSTGTRERRAWHQLNDRLAGGDTLVVVAIDHIGRTWQDTVRSICELRDRGVKIRSLAEAEKEWTRYLEADEGSPEAFFGQVLTMFAAWVADQELASIKRRTREGLERARQEGKTLGPPRKFTDGQVEAIRRIREGVPASGRSPPTSSARPAPSCGCWSGKPSLSPVGLRAHDFSYGFLLFWIRLPLYFPICIPSVITRFFPVSVIDTPVPYSESFHIFGVSHFPFVGLCHLRMN